MSICYTKLVWIGVTVIRDLFLKFKETFLCKTFIIFTCIGIINTLNNSCFSLIYNVCGVQKNIAAMLGYFTSLNIAYFLNSWLTFKQPLSFKKHVKYLISYAPNFTIFAFMTFIAFNKWHLPQFIGTIVSVLLGGPIAFIIVKLFTFNNK